MGHAFGMAAYPCVLEVHSKGVSQLCQPLVIKVGFIHMSSHDFLSDNMWQMTIFLIFTSKDYFFPKSKT